jgi:FkbM family methyltransferase
VRLRFSVIETRNTERYDSIYTVQTACFAVGQILGVDGAISKNRSLVSSIVSRFQVKPFPVLADLLSLLFRGYIQQAGTFVMGISRQLKRAFLIPFSRDVPTVLVGSLDQWALPTGLVEPSSFVISAGVGTSITFEEDLVSMFRTRIILLDPSPTGIRTMEAKPPNDLIEFSSRGLAKRSGNVTFDPPDRPDEGSFKKGTGSDGLIFKCVSLPDLLKENEKSKIDLLKIDVEGFEYEIIASIIENRIPVDIICMEIHHNRVIDIDETIADAAKLIVRLGRNGYVIVYNKNMDFTFLHKRALRRIS